MTCVYTYENLTTKQFRKLKEAVSTITFMEEFRVNEVVPSYYSCTITFSEPILLPKPEELNV